MPDLHLSLALNDYVHTADIANGRVRAPGIDLTIVSLPFESVAMRFGANLEFDVAEYSLANYCAHLAEPKPSPMVALPVFTSRVFRHSSIYVNDASNIVDAGDLAGRTVGIPQWSQTATVYGVAFSRMTPASGCARSAGCRPAWTSRDGATGCSRICPRASRSPRDLSGP
jgi:4,5-dihydroxyphthalate decarboxylase